MSGLLNKKPWPDDSMTDCFVVIEVGDTLVDVSDGRVLSLQPDGTWDKRAAGTAGPWEVFGRNGSLKVYNSNGKVLAFLHWPNVPNLL